MANILDIPQNFSTTLNVGGGIDSSQTTGIVLTSVTGLPTDGGILAFDWKSPIDVTTIEYIEYAGLSTNTLTGVVRGQEGYSAHTHANGATIVGVVSRAHIKRLKDNFTAEHDRSSGVHNNLTVLTTSQQTTPSTPSTGHDSLYVKSDDKLYILNHAGVETAVGVTLPTDGWTAVTDTFTYVSANSFKISGVDRTAIYTKGTRVKFTNNATTYYGVVASSSFSTDTTVTLIANSDYSIANSAITNPSYSYAVNPQGYPGWFNFTTTFGGFSANPTGSILRFNAVGNICTIAVRMSNQGTSNATTFTLTGPVVPVTITNHIWGSIWWDGQDNSTGLTASGRVYISSASMTINAFKDMSNGSWTNTGGKAISFSLSYEF